VRVGEPRRVSTRSRQRRRARATVPRSAIAGADCRVGSSVKYYCCPPPEGSSARHEYARFATDRDLPRAIGRKSAGTATGHTARLAAADGVFDPDDIGAALCAAGHDRRCIAGSLTQAAIAPAPRAACRSP
jgi:hypothetical protein